MKNIEVGALIQVLANVGVIASIVFLAIQVNQNSDVQRAQARAARAQIRIDGASAIAANPTMLDVISKERRGEPLTETEELMLNMNVRAVLVGWQYIYGEYREGLIEDVDVPTADWRRAFSGSASFNRVWQLDSETSFRPDFVAWMNKNVVPSAPPSPP